MWVQHIYLRFDGEKKYDWEISGDWQIGSKACDESRIDWWVDKVVTNQKSIWTILGDVEDDDRPTTRIAKRRSFADRTEVLTNAGRDHCAWLDKAILPKILKLAERPSTGILAGHHWSELTTTLNSVQYLCAAANKHDKNRITYLGEMSAFICFHFVGEGKYEGVKLTRMAHVQHGTGGGSALGSALRRVAKTAEGFYASVYIRAHSCSLEAAKKNKLWTRPETLDKPELIDDTLLFVNVGCATRGFDIGKGEPLYPEAAMMNPATMGWATIGINIRPPLPWEDQQQKMIVEFTATI